METNTLDTASMEKVQAYQDENYLVKHEKLIVSEMIDTIKTGDLEGIKWLNQFGTSIRHIHMNVYAYRKHLEFGFTEIALDKYGWFERALLLQKEDLIFGNADRYNEHSNVYLGCGANGIWTYAVNCNYGTAGSSYGLSVYGRQYQSREAAMNAGITELKTAMTSVLDHSDTTNYKQDIIKYTLKAINQFQLSLVQLTLF
jgi:hypothetical protein